MLDHSEAPALQVPDPWFLGGVINSSLSSASPYLILLLPFGFKQSPSHLPADTKEKVQPQSPSSSSPSIPRGSCGALACPRGALQVSSTPSTGDFWSLCWPSSPSTARSQSKHRAARSLSSTAALPRRALLFPHLRGCAMPALPRAQGIQAGCTAAMAHPVSSTALMGASQTSHSSTQSLLRNPTSKLRTSLWHFLD